MSDLVIQNKINQLPVGLQSFATLRVGKGPYKNLLPKQKTKVCLDIITVAHASTGNKGDDANLLAFQTQELMACLSEKYGELTVEEIKKAIEMLIAGEFGPYMGLYRASYYKALKSYYELPQRTQCMKEYLALEEAPKPTLTQEEKDAIVYKGLLKEFSTYKEAKVKDVPRFNPKLTTVYYNVIKKLNLVTWSEMEANKIEDNAKIQLKRMNNEESDFLEGIVGEHDFTSMCKLVAIKTYFDKCITTKFDLEHELKKHIKPNT